MHIRNHFNCYLLCLKTDLHKVIFKVERSELLSKHMQITNTCIFIFKKNYTNKKYIKNINIFTFFLVEWIWTQTLLWQGDLTSYNLASYDVKAPCPGKSWVHLDLNENNKKIRFEFRIVCKLTKIILSIYFEGSSSTLCT